MTTALYTSILNDIYGLTARPDLVTETALAIRKATMKAHGSDFWKDDLTSALPAVPDYSGLTTLAFRYALDLTDAATFPLLRRVSYIREYNNPLTGYEIQFKEFEADSILDDYLVENINYWYRVGQALQLRANKAVKGLQVGYWKYPKIDPATYDSWIATKFPDIIVEEAAASVFKMIGKDTEYARLRDNWEENLHLITMAEIGEVR